MIFEKRVSETSVYNITNEQTTCKQFNFLMFYKVQHKKNIIQNKKKQYYKFITSNLTDTC